MSSTKAHIVEVITFVCILAVVLGSFVPAVAKPVPPGVDAAVYINDVNWMLDHHQILRPYQATYHGSGAYPSPGVDLLLGLLAYGSGYDVAYPLFVIFQLFLIVLLVMTSYLVGSIYSRRVAMLFPLFLTGSYAISRLFIGSTVANLLAFSIVNGIFYAVHHLIAKKNYRMAWLIPVLLAALFFVHGYLTAPIFIPLFFGYALLLLFLYPTGRARIVGYLCSRNRYWWIIGIGLCGAILFGLFLYFRALIWEGAVAFLGTTSTNKFRQLIPVAKYGAYLGPWLTTLGIVGLGFYVFHWRQNLRTYRILPLLWLAALALLLQTYRIGVNFFFERFVFLGSMFLTLFAAYGVDRVCNLLRTPATQTARFIIVTALTVPLIVNGISYTDTLYRGSNRVSASQISGLTLLKSLATRDTIVLSHENAVSQTYHDQMLADVTFHYYPTKAGSCPGGDAICHAFQNAHFPKSIKTLRDAGLRYFLFMTPNAEGNNFLYGVLSNYRASPYRILYETRDIWVIELPPN